MWWFLRRNPRLFRRIEFQWNDDAPGRKTARRVCDKSGADLAERKGESAVVTEFKLEQLDRVMELWLQENQFAHPFVPAEFWRKVAPTVREQLPQATLFVYEEGGRVLGFVGLIDSHVAGLFVDGAVRRRGIGAALLNRCKQAHPRLTLEVFCRNEGALNFYLAQGFRAVARQYNSDMAAEEYTMEWLA